MNKRLYTLIIIGVTVFTAVSVLSPNQPVRASQNCWKSVEEYMNTPANMANFDWQMCSDNATSPNNTPPATLDQFDGVNPLSQFDNPADSPMNQFDAISIPVPLRNQNDPNNGSLGQSACGPTALGMIADYYHNVLGINTINNLSTADLANIAGTQSGVGTIEGDLNNVAQQIGFTNTLSNPVTSFGSGFTALVDAFSGGSVAYGELTAEVNNGHPAIVGVDSSPYDNGHALVVTGISGGNVYVNNPWDGQQQVIGEAEFRAMWGSRGYGYIIPKP